MYVSDAPFFSFSVFFFCLIKKHSPNFHSSGVKKRALISVRHVSFRATCFVLTLLNRLFFCHTNSIHKYRMLLRLIIDNPYSQIWCTRATIFKSFIIIGLEFIWITCVFLGCFTTGRPSSWECSFGRRRGKKYIYTYKFDIFRIKTEWQILMFIIKQIELHQINHNFPFVLLRVLLDLSMSSRFPKFAHPKSSHQPNRDW